MRIGGYQRLNWEYRQTRHHAFSLACSLSTMNDPSSQTRESWTDRFWSRWWGGGGLVLLLRLGTLCCFAGWTWVHFYWEAPYGVLFWQSDTYQLAEDYGVSWDQFVGTGAYDGLVQTWLARIAWLYLACTLMALTVQRRAWAQMAVLITGSGLLTVLSYAKYLSAQQQLPMFIEHGGQMLMPTLLVFALAFGVRHRATVTMAVLAFVMTFAGHGSYALGLWPTPSNFYAMTSVILNVEYDAAKLFLRIAGVLDFIVCIGIFIPGIRRSCAVYAAVWGFLTAIARPVASMSWDLYYYGADQYVHEAILRTPHWVIPLYLFFAMRTSKANVTTEVHEQIGEKTSITPMAEKPKIQVAH